MTHGDQPPPPPPPPPPSAPSRPAWLPVAMVAGVIAVLVVIIVTVTGGDDGPPDTTVAASTSTTTSIAPISTTAAPTSTTTTAAPTSTTEAVPDTVPEVGGSWTLLLYMLGDNNLEPAIFSDLEELALLPEDEDLTVLALIDRHDEYTEREMFNLPDWTGAKLVRVDREQLTELADYGELDMGDPAVLADFLTTGIQTAPADHYALVLWDHGAINGVGNDDSSGDGLTPFEIADALELGLAAAGVDRLDLLGFDACMMGAYEIAAAVAPYADYMIGSEENEPNGGWNYEAFDYIALNPEGTVEGLGREIITRFLALEAQGSPDVTLSLLELPDVDSLSIALEAFTEAAIGDMERYAPAIGRHRVETMSFAGNPDPSKDWFMIDLEDFFTRLAAAEPDLAQPIEAVQAALDDVVIESGTGPVHDGAGGLSAHFPPNPEVWFEPLSSVMPEPWLRFVRAFYAAGEAIPEEEQPDIEEAQDQAEFVMDQDGLSVTADFNLAAEDTVVDVTLYSGVPQEDGSIIYYEQSQGWTQGTTAFGFYDLTVLQFDDGEDQALAYTALSYSDDALYATIDVPVAYFPPGSDEYVDSLITVVYDTTTGQFTETMYEVGTDYQGVLEPDPAGLLFPWLWWELPDGTLEWRFSTDIGLWADLDNLVWEWVEFTEGQALYSEIWVCDFGGNCDWAWVESVVGAEAGAGRFQICRNDWWGFEFAHPSWLEPWPAQDAQFACESFLDREFTAIDDQGAFREALVTVEVLSGDALTQRLDLIVETADFVEEVRIPGFQTPAVLFEVTDPGDEIYGYVVPVSEDGDGLALLITGWEFLSPAVELRDPVDTIANTIEPLQ